MIRGAITSNIDVAQVVLYAFFVFFAGLVFYLRREDRREGYPLESEASGRQKARGFLLIPTPKLFKLAGGATAVAPRFDKDARTLNAAKVAPWPGAPLAPIGDPMKAEVGPGAYALRADVPDKMHDGREVLVPLRVATNFAVAAEDINPIGMTVIGADRKIAGTIRDLWVDRSEALLRYYEIEVDGAGRTALLPVTFARMNKSRRRVYVDAILAGQFAGAPATLEPDKVTMLEEEKITAYYGAGTLYATPQRAEPLL
jgi:photosynthetic reaction center H subunit